MTKYHTLGLNDMNRDYMVRNETNHPLYMMKILLNDLTNGN